MPITFISIVISFKIAVTLLMIGLPFLIFPKERLERMSGVVAQSDTFFRLYGIAIIALLVGYATAYPLIANNQFPWSVALMGALSNGGASLILLRGGSRSAKRIFVPIYGAIFVAIMLSLTMPQTAMRQLF